MQVIYALFKYYEEHGVPVLIGVFVTGVEGT